MKEMRTAVVTAIVVGVGIILAAPAQADNNTVSKYQDPGSSVSGGLHGQVRPADMSAYKIESRMARPQTIHDTLWKCYDSETSHRPGHGGSERCKDRGQ